MTLFEYRAINPTGRILVGTMEAASPAEVAEHLDGAGYVTISTKPTSGNARRRSWRERLTPEPKSEDITGFTIDLAMLLKGGVVLDEALLILAQMETRGWLARLIRSLHVELAGGKSLSQVVAMHPRLFPPIYVKMIEVAETAGRLEEALARIASERQRLERLRKRIFSAISYPLFLVVAAIAVLCFVLLFVVPQFELALQGFRDRLDPSALFVFQMSRSFSDNFDLVVFGAVALLAAALAVKRLGRGRPVFIRVLAALPFTGRIVTYDLTLTFCRTLGILLDNGVDISTSLKLIRGVVRLPRAAEEIDRVMAHVRQGRRLSEALVRHPLLPGHVIQMLRVGEESGNLADSAARVAVFYEAKLDTALGRLTAIIGPAMMIGVSLLVAWLIISVMSALISVNDLLV